MILPTYLITYTWHAYTYAESDKSRYIHMDTCVCLNNEQETYKY